MEKLKGKVVVVTGGNSGIGFGIARELKNEGAAGAIVGRNQPASLSPCEHGLLEQGMFLSLCQRTVADANS